MDDAVPVTVIADDGEQTIEVAEGRVLRDALLEHGFDVYGSISRVANCGGRGFGSTCGVRMDASDPNQEQWHDAAAERWGSPGSRVKFGSRNRSPSS
ncbi:MAG: ferredoxin [Natronomonas sp.]|jgi:ferredoxin